MVALIEFDPNYKIVFGLVQEWLLALEFRQGIKSRYHMAILTIDTFLQWKLSTTCVFAPVTSLSTRWEEANRFQDNSPGWCYSFYLPQKGRKLTVSWLYFTVKKGNQTRYSNNWIYVPNLAKQSQELQSWGCTHSSRIELKQPWQESYLSKLRGRRQYNSQTEWIQSERSATLFLRVTVRLVSFSQWIYITMLRFKPTNQDSLDKEVTWTVV